MKVFHSIRVTEDKIATGNTDLVNNKPYYFTVIAYAHNEYINTLLMFRLIAQILMLQVH